MLAWVIIPPLWPACWAAALFCVNVPLGLRSGRDFCGGGWFRTVEGWRWEWKRVGDGMGGLSSVFEGLRGVYVMYLVSLAVRVAVTCSSTHGGDFTDFLCWTVGEIAWVCVLGGHDY